MGLNIVAERKVSLKGFGEGWDDCFIIVRAANETQRKAYAEQLLRYRGKMNEAIASEDQADIQSLAIDLDSKADTAVREFASELIQRGKVISTDDEGKSELVAFGKEDIPVIIEALGFSWLNELVEVATGADRLKAKS